jgi:hypothetical protein
MPAKGPLPRHPARRPTTAPQLNRLKNAGKSGLRFASLDRVYCLGPAQVRPAPSQPQIWMAARPTALLVCRGTRLGQRLARTSGPGQQKTPGMECRGSNTAHLSYDDQGRKLRWMRNEACHAPTLPKV